jgi:hypothetical protein
VAVHFSKKDASNWKQDRLKAGKRIVADSYPNGGRLPSQPVSARGKRRAASRNSK